MPLYKLLSKNIKFKWDKEQEEAFENLKQEIINCPKMQIPDLNKEFILEADSSNFAIGATLLRKEGQSETPVHFISRKLNSAEQNYTVSEKECLAVVWAVQYLKVYLHKRFTIRTDHQELKGLLKIKNPGRIARRMAFLQCYNYELKHKRL